MDFPTKYLFNANGSAVVRSYADSNQTMLTLDTGKVGNEALGWTYRTAA